jgi:hypothetical protein
MSSINHKQDIILVDFWHTPSGLICSKLPSNFIRTLTHGIGNRGDLVLLILHKLKFMLWQIENQNVREYNHHMCVGDCSSMLSPSIFCGTYNLRNTECVCRSNHCCLRCTPCHGKCSHYVLARFVEQLIKLISIALVKLQPDEYDMLINGIHPNYNLVRCNKLITDAQLDQELPFDGPYGYLYGAITHNIHYYYDRCIIINNCAMNGFIFGQETLVEGRLPVSDYEIMKLDWLT